MVVDGDHVGGSSRAAILHDLYRGLHRLLLTRLDSEGVPLDPTAEHRLQRSRRHGHPTYNQASEKVRRAVKAGKLVRPSACQCCGASGFMTAHHVSYAPGRDLEVRWLCKPCHELTHHPALRPEDPESADRVDVPELRAFRARVERQGTRWIEVLPQGAQVASPQAPRGEWLTAEFRPLTRYRSTCPITNEATDKWRVLPCYTVDGAPTDVAMDAWPGRYFAHREMRFGDIVPRICRVLVVTSDGVRFLVLKRDRPRRRIDVERLHVVSRTDFERSHLGAWVTPKAVRVMARLGQRLRGRRERLGWSQSELARRAGVQQAQVSMLEAGKRANPTGSILVALAAALGCTMDALLREPGAAIIAPRRRRDV